MGVCRKWNECVVPGSRDPGLLPGCTSSSSTRENGRGCTSGYGLGRLVTTPAARRSILYRAAMSASRAIALSEKLWQRWRSPIPCVETPAAAAAVRVTTTPPETAARAGAAKQGLKRKRLGIQPWFRQCPEGGE